jgi:hypothetical protein
MFDQEQCQTCNELWCECAVAAMEVTRLAQEVEALCAAGRRRRDLGLLYRFRIASRERAEADARLQEHLAAAHPGDPRTEPRPAVLAAGSVVM